MPRHARVGNGMLSVCIGTVTPAFECAGRRHTLLHRALFSAMELGGALLPAVAVAAGLAPSAHLLTFALAGFATAAPLVLFRLPSPPFHQPWCVQASLVPAARPVDPIAPQWKHRPEGAAVR